MGCSVCMLAGLGGITTTTAGWSVMKVAKKVKYSNPEGTKIIGTLPAGTLLRVYSGAPTQPGVVLFERPPPKGGFWSTYTEDVELDEAAWLADEANVIKRTGYTIKNALVPATPSEMSKVGGANSGGTGGSASTADGQGTEDAVGEAGKPGSSIGMGSKVGPGKTTFKKDEIDQYLPPPSSSGPGGIPWWIIVALPVGATWWAPIALVAGAATWAITRK